MGELYVTAAQVETEKSKRRSGKSAHVAVAVKSVAVYAATIRSIEAASRTLGPVFVIHAGVLFWRNVHKPVSLLCLQA